MKISLTSDGKHFLTAGLDSWKIRNFPEYKQVSPTQGIFELPITDVTVEKLDAMGAEYSEEALVAKQYIDVRHQTHELAATTTAVYKDRKELPDHNLVLHPKFPLACYQQVAAYNMFNTEAYALFMEQGTGKTPIVICDICNSAMNLDANRMFFATIICPNAVRLNWQKEIEKFATCDVKTTVIRGGKIKKIDLLIEAAQGHHDASVIIMGYDTVRSIWDTLSLFPFDAGYADESHYIKGPNTKRSKYLHFLRDNCSKRAILTGTPIANTHLDLYSQFEFLGQGYSGFYSWKSFKNFYGVWDRSKGREGINKLVGVQNLPFMKKRLAQFAIQFTKDEVLPDLPEKTYDVHEVEMTPTQAEIYKKVAEDLIAEIGDDETLSVNNILTMMLRLAQITSGFVKFDAQYSDEGELLAEGRIHEFDDNPKLKAVGEILQSKKPHQKTIIWACWRQDIKALTEYIAQLLGEDSVVTYFGGTSQDDRIDAERRFNEDPTCRVFVGNPATAGVGLNLLGYDYNGVYPEGHPARKTYCDRVLYFSQNWSMIQRSQSEDRAHRRGIKRSVQITDLCVADTIDETIRARVVEKKLKAIEISDVRDLLKGLANAVIV